MTEKMQRLDVSVPPMLEEALGYDGSSRWVAFYWTPWGDELVYDDGTTSTDGSWHAWLTFKRHPCIAPHLEPYRLGNSDEEAKHWLLLDQETRALYVGEREEISRFLSENAPPLPSYTPEEIDTIARALSEGWTVQTVDPEVVKQRMEKEVKLVKNLKDWLDNSKLAI